MVRRIPPLNPLRVFEAVARTENLTAAAQQLHVTQSAVSRQIATLEEYLGLQLFKRERHGVSLTRAGQTYADQILPAFDVIADATDKLTKSSRQGALRVRTYTTFATKWLVPRLARFREQHPNIEIRITNAVPDVDFDRDMVDVAVQFGDGRWPDVRAELLFFDEIEPVCSPEYLAEHAPNAKYPESLLRQRLLESRYRRTDWSDWLQAAGLADEAKASERMSFGSTFLTWQAAADGLGLAMGQSALLGAELRSRKLVRPFARPLRREMGYYLVRPQQQRESRKVSVFRDWLLAECGALV
ncbi:transcriptional regulator GcvA [Aquincola sp. MAHUQ-54]|uniref:Transcriptional regulator GcvA n=1 Tax=Aquincola agrisoli TaxID=3119538 RepID=A0AAW9QS29_9BURK